MDVRNKVQNIAGKFQLRLDVFPRVDYQSLPWIEIRSDPKCEVAKACWKVIEVSWLGNENQKIVSRKLFKITQVNM